MPNLKEILKEFVATANAGEYKTEGELLSAFPELSGYNSNTLKEFVSTANAGQYANEDELLAAFPEFGQEVKKKEESVPLWLQKQEQAKPKQERTLPFLESKPSGISLGSQRVPETAPMFEAPPMRTPEEAQAIVEAPEDQSKVAESEQGWLLNTVSSLDRGFAKNLIGNPVKGMGTLLEGATSKVFGGTGKGPISDALISFGNYYNNAIDELTPQDEDFKNTLTDQFGQAFGQVASLIMTGGVAGAGKEGAAIAATAPTGIVGTVAGAGKQLASTLVSPTAISGGLSMGQAEFDRAKEAGATDEQAYEVFFKNAAVGSVLEQIPVMQFLKRFNQSTAGGVTNYIKTKGVAGLTGGFEEMTTEVLQQLYSNKTAQEVYNINQQLLEGVGESGGVGFGVGFILNAMGARVKKLKKEGNTAEAQLIENQIDNFESKPKGPPPTYSVNGIKIESPEVINQMIDNMDATDLANSNIEITNDPELSVKMQDKMVTSSIKDEVRSANPDIDEDTLDQITALEKERKKFEGKKTQSAKDKLASINSQIKTLQENAVQKPSTEESVLRAEESQVGLQEVGEGNAQVQAPTSKVKKSIEKINEQRDQELNSKVLYTDNPTEEEIAKRKSERAKEINDRYDGIIKGVIERQAPAEEVVQEEVVDEDLQALFDRLPDETEAVAPATPVVASIGEVSIESAFDEDGEIDTDAEDAVRGIAKERDLGITRDRELATVARDKNGNVIGGAYTSYDNSTGEYTFDVVVSKEAEGSGVGSKLLNSVIEIPSDIKEFNPKAKVKVDVVNPQMQAMLEKRGFEVTAKTGTDRVTMEKAKPKKKVSSKTPKAKSVPIPVAIPKPVAPAPKPVAVVSQPAPRIQGPESLRQEYTNKINDVRVNKDKSRTPKQIEERIVELRAEYKKLDAEMTAPRPKAEPEAKAAPKKAAPAPKAEAKPSKKDEAIARDIKRLESDIDVTERNIVNFEEEIEIEKGNIKDLLEEIKKRRDELKGKKMSKDDRVEAQEQIKADIIDANNEHTDLVQGYQSNIAAEKADLKKYQKELAKLKAGQAETKAEPTSVVEEDEPSYEDIKDLEEIYDIVDEDEDDDDFEPKSESFLKKSSKILDNASDGINKFKRENLSMGLPVVTAEAIVKALKVLVKGGILLEEAIPRVATSMNIAIKQVVAAIKELAAIGSTVKSLDNLRTQTKSEIQAAKEGARNVNDAIKAITDYFNFNAERGNLTRRDLGRVINVISKVKDQKSLDKAADKIFDIIDKAKTDVIEVSQSKALISQIKLEARAAIGAKKDINQKRKELSNTIKEMETTGKISTAKAQTLINKISKVNLDNPASVDSFLDYVENVFENAAYEVEIAGINAKLGKAKNNVNKKIGTAKTLTTVLNRLFSIKPSLIPVEILDDYKDIIDMFGDSAAVLSVPEITEVIQQVQNILDQIDNQLSLVPALTTKLFGYDKAILNEDGALDYSATIEKMKNDKVIDDDEYELMRKYKPYIMPKTSVIPKTKSELAEEKKVLVKQVNEAANEAAISLLASDDEKKMASSVIKLAKTKAVESLDNRQLENLLKIFDNFSNGYFPAYANGINNDLIAAENAGFLSKAIAKAKMPTLTKLKLRITNKRKALFQRVKSTPLFNIDELFGDFKTKDVFNSLFNALAQNQQRYTLELEKINQRLEDALNKIAKGYWNNENKIVESKMKMAIYRIQREFEANPGNPSVNPAIEYINETIKAIKGGNTNYGDEDAKMLEKISKDYSDGNGGIDAKKLKNSFNTAEQEAIDLFDKINKEIEDKAIFTGDVIRGDKVKLLNEYNHISVLPTKGQEADPIADVMSKFDPKNVVSTKAKSLIERSRGAKPINFDIFSTVQRGAKFVLMDYYLTNPVRVARKTINTTRKMMEDNVTLTEDTNTIIDVINEALELALKSSLDQSAFNDSFTEQVIQEMAKTGYRAMLGGIPRAVTELTSNMAYVAIVNPKEWFTGLNMMKIIRGGKAVDIMESVGSKVISRVYGSDPLKGRMVDPSVLSKRTGIGASKLTGETVNVIATIHNNTTKKLKNTAELTADTLISSPDKIMMRPLWFGSFDKAFQDFSGKKPDYKKIEVNDADYMIKNKESLEAAGRVADEKVTMAGNVDNPYMNALRAYIASDERGKAVTKFAKVFDNFMLKFQIGEYLTARRGLYAFFGNGNISKGQAVKLMAAVVTRMTVYAVMSKMASEFFYGLFLDDEDEDDDKTFAQKLGQGLASTFTSLFLGRDFGNAARSVVNYGIEKVNENYLDFLRDGEYDPYEDAIQYTFIPPEKKGKSLEAFDVIANISGPYSPAVKSLNFVTKKLTEEPKKEASAIERQEKEKNIRVPLEILGNLGYVPMYKDIRAIVNKSIYRELDKEMKAQENKQEEFKPMGLNRSDLKRYYPEVYEEYYGEGTQDAAKRKLEYEKRILEQRIKDDYYNYVPKQKIQKGFGSKEFGSGSSKKGGGFGSKGFGE